jgi:hypothetical protein
MTGRNPTEDEIKNREEDIYLTEQSIKELLQGKIVFDDDGRIWIHPPKTDILGLRKKLKGVI